MAAAAAAAAAKAARAAAIADTIAILVPVATVKGSRHDPRVTDWVQAVRRSETVKVPCLVLRSDDARRAPTERNKTFAQWFAEGYDVSGSRPGCTGCGLHKLIRDSGLLDRENKLKAELYDEVRHDSACLWRRSSRPMCL